MRILLAVIGWVALLPGLAWGQQAKPTVLIASGIQFRHNQEPLTGQKKLVTNGLFDNYTVRLDGFTVSKLAMPATEVTIDPLHFTTEEARQAAHQLLLQLRRQAPTDWSANRQQVGNARWNHILFPHGSVWPWRWHFSRQGRAKRRGYRRERDDISAFERDLTQLLLAEAQQAGLNTPGPTDDRSRPSLSLGPTVPDDQLPVVVDQQVLAQLRREPDPFDPTKYRLVMQRPGSKELYKSVAWLPQNTPGTRQAVDDMLDEANSPNVAQTLGLDYWVAVKADLQPRLKPGSSADDLLRRANEVGKADSTLRLLLRPDVTTSQPVRELYGRYDAAERALAKARKSGAPKSLARLAQQADDAKLALLQNDTPANREQVQLLWGDYKKAITSKSADSAKARSGIQALLKSGIDFSRFRKQSVATTEAFNSFASSLNPGSQTSRLRDQLLAAAADSMKLRDLLKEPTAWGNLKTAYDKLTEDGTKFKEVLRAPVDSQQVMSRARRFLATSRDFKANLRDALAGPVAHLLDRVLPQPETTASNTPNLLFEGHLLLPTQPTRRLARLYVHDRSQSASAANRARYAICLQYSATDGTYEDVGSWLTECRPPTGYVGVSTELAVLERSVFVNQLYNALAAKMASLRSYADQLTDKSAAVEARAKLIREQIVPNLPLADPAAKQVVTKDANAQTVLKDTTTVVTETLAARSLRESLRDFYDEFIRSQERLAETPRAGTVLLGQRLMTYNDDGPTGHFFEVDSVGLEVEDGSAMGLKAYGNYGGRQLLFETYAPLDLSSDYALSKQWYWQRLFAQSSRLRGSRPDHDGAEQGLYLNLHELLRYYPALLARTSDRSPANGVYVFRPQDPLAKRILRKDPTSKLLQARVYSDLVGLTGDRPNGLVQAEVTKRFLLYNNFLKRSRVVQFGWCNYIQPTLTVSKIEDNEKFLVYQQPAQVVPGVNRNQVRLVRTIDLLRYTNVRVGFSQNLAHLKTPSLKSDFSLDYSVALSRVGVRDPQAINLQKDRDSTLNMVTYGPQLLWRIRPDSRFGAQLRAAVLIQKLFNNVETDPAPTQLPAYRVNLIQEDYGAGPADHGHTFFGSWFKTNGQTLLQVEMLLWANVSDNSELFFRTQFSQLRYATYQTYFQMQLGYQFDVFTNRRTAVKPVSIFPK